ncbi:hypothetical protein PO909_008211 [Leuciscus waleckii]
MPPLPLDERIVVIQRPKSLALRVASPPATSQSSSHRPANHNEPPPRLPQPQLQPPRSYPSSNYLSLECNRKQSSHVQRDKGERGAPFEGSGHNASHCHSNGIVTLGPRPHKHTHTIDIKVSLDQGGRGGSYIDKGRSSSLTRSGNIKGNRTKRVSLHLDSGQGERKCKGKSSESVEKHQNHHQSQNRTQHSIHHPNQLTVSPGGILEFVPAQRQQSKSKPTRERDLSSKSCPATASYSLHSERDISSLGNKENSKLGPGHQLPQAHSLSRHHSSTPLPHAAILSPHYPAVPPSLPSRAPSSYQQPRPSRTREHRPQILHALPLSPTSSRRGRGNSAGYHGRSTSSSSSFSHAQGTSAANGSCVSGCNPKASQTGSSTCSYCSSDPIVVTFNPHRGNPPNMGRNIGAHTMGGYQPDDDDYSVRTIWPEELAKKMTRSKTQPIHHNNSGNGGNPVILDCRNLMEFTRSQLTDQAGRRRLQQGKMAVLDFIGSGNSGDQGRDSLKRLWNKGAEREGGHTLPSAQSLHLVLNSLNREQDEENGRGKDANLQVHSRLMHLSLPLSSSLPASLSEESVMTPDVENAVISPILPFLFLGNERDAEDLNLLLRLNIGFVVNVTTHLPLYHLDTGLVRYKRLPATDNSKQNLRQYFEEVFEFIEEAHQCGRGVLVHCQAGVSRSATIVIAYLMKHTLMTMTDAYKYVRGRRPIVSPNLNFMGQLLEFERDLNSGVTPRILTPKLSGLETQV